MNFTTILSETRRFSKTTATEYSTPEIVESANSAMERAFAIIRQAEGRWQLHDSNDTTLPFSTTALVADQQDYELDPDHYRIERFEVKDEAGNWTKLIPFDQADVFDQSITDFLSGSGVPQYYDLVGNSVLLYPKPSYSQAASLKSVSEGGPNYFTISDSTKTPGFNPLFHKLIPLWCAYDYNSINDVKTADRLKADITDMEAAMAEHYARRNKDEHITLKARIFNYR